MWTQVQNAVPFLVGRQAHGVRGGITYSLHRDGRKGWVVKQYSDKAFVTNPVLYDRARTQYNILLSSS